MNDHETAAAAETIKKAAEQIKDQIDNTKTLPKAEQENAKQMAEALEEASDTLKSKLEDGSPRQASSSRSSTT